MNKISILGLKESEYQFWASKKYIINFNTYTDNNYVMGQCEKSCYQHPLLNKLYLCKIQGLKYGKDKIKGTPKKNYWIKAESKKSKYFKPLKVHGNKSFVGDDCFWMEELNGIRKNIYMILQKGEVIWSQMSYLYYDQENQNIKEKITHDSYENINDIILKYFPYYNGNLTLELIGDKILDIKLFIPSELFPLFDKENFCDFLICNYFNFESTENWPNKKLEEPCFCWRYYFKNPNLIEKIFTENLKTIKSIQKNNVQENILIINTCGTSEKPKVQLKIKKNS